MASEPDSKIIDLQTMVTALATAVIQGLLEREHAKGILKRFLSMTNLNTPTPQRTGAGMDRGAKPVEVSSSKKVEEKPTIPAIPANPTISAKKEGGE